MIKFIEWSRLWAWQKTFHWDKQEFSSRTCNLLGLKTTGTSFAKEKVGFCVGFIQNDPLFYKTTSRWQTIMKIWFFEVVMAFEMCKILVWEGERPGKPSVLGGWCLHDGRFVCVLSPTSHRFFANSLKNWTRSLIGAWRGSSCSGICIYYTQRAPPPPLVALAYFLMVWNKSPLVLGINFIHLDANEFDEQQKDGFCILLNLFSFF